MRLYTSTKEAVATIVVLESFILKYPDSATAEIVEPLIERIRTCLEKQGQV